MEIRYLGFDQQQNLRAFRFDVVAKGEPIRHFTVTADLDLFRAHRIGIQEGPVLSANKLTADLERHSDEAHQLTEDDLRAHATARDTAEARRIEARRMAARRPANHPAAHDRSPWRGTGGQV